jgi:hypothetical protein
MSAPQGSGSSGGLSPSTFLGTYSGSNPSNPANGYWWYRVDLGQIWGNINGTIMPLQNTGSVTIISSNTTIANTDVYNDVIVTNNATLTIYGNVTFHGNVIIENGSTLLSSNPNASNSSPATNNYQFLGNFYLNGTYEIAEYNIDNILNSITLTTINSSGGANPTISGSGTLNIGSNTLTISENITVTIPTISGSGTLSILSGYTLTINANTTLSIPTLTGSGTLSVSSGYTLTVSVNITLSISTISGSGTLSVSSGYTLTQGASITLSVSTVNIAGTWANAGYGITIPSGSTVTVTVTGSFTTGSSAGTLTVDGTCYWFGTISAASGSSASISFPLNFAGTGIFVSAPSNSTNGTANALSLSSASLSAGGHSSNSATTSGKYEYYTISSLEGSAVGKYYLGLYDSTVSTYAVWLLVYIGTANTSYSINSNLIFSRGSAEASGDTGYAYNSSSSAGSITITGTFYA